MTTPFWPGLALQTIGISIPCVCGHPFHAPAISDSLRYMCRFSRSGIFCSTRDGRYREPPRIRLNIRPPADAQLPVLSPPIAEPTSHDHSFNVVNGDARQFGTSRYHPLWLTPGAFPPSDYRDEQPGCAPFCGTQPGLRLHPLIQTERRMMDQFSVRLDAVERQSLNHLGRAAGYAHARKGLEAKPAIVGRIAYQSRSFAGRP